MIKGDIFSLVHVHATVLIGMFVLFGIDILNHNEKSKILLLVNLVYINKINIRIIV